MGEANRASTGAWITVRAAGKPRVSLRSAKGFTRVLRDIGEDFLAQSTAVGVLRVAHAKRTELDAVCVATALNRIAKCPDAPRVLGDARFAALVAWLP